jgi:hypothetical protein
MPFPVTAEPAIPPPVFRLGPSLVWSAFVCPAIPPGLGPDPSPDTHVTVSSEDFELAWYYDTG